MITYNKSNNNKDKTFKSQYVWGQSYGTEL